MGDEGPLVGAIDQGTGSSRFLVSSDLSMVACRMHEETACVQLQLLHADISWFYMPLWQYSRLIYMAIHANDITIQS